MTQMSEYPSGVFCWVDLVAHDLDAAKRWYGELFGWTAKDAGSEGGPPYAMFYKDDKLVAGAGQMSEAMRGAGIAPMWNDYVKVDDCLATEARAIELGGRVSIPTMQVPGAGWLCFLQDPSGANFGLWQPAEHPGAQLVNAPGSFCWNELATRDVAGAKRFYAELLGWDYKADPGPHGGYDTITVNGRENGGVLPMQGSAGDDEGPHWNTYFAVADADATLATITATGGKLLFGPDDIPGVGRFAVVRDPQGAKFVIIQLSHPPD
ncbi:MAG: VOC family protein [Enhygromyxa sp.]